MRTIDLSHVLDADMPLYPGTPAPRFEETAAIETDGFREKRISLCVHTGTHVDAPAHLIDGAETLDRLPVDTFCGPALVVDAGRPDNPVITLDDVRGLEDRLKAVSFLLLRTGWSCYWGSGRYFRGYPILSAQAARWLAGTALKGVGLDTLSADAVDAPGLPIHNILLGGGMVIVENLTNLSALPDEGFIFACLPLNIRDADGSPVRAAAIIP